MPEKIGKECVLLFDDIDFQNKNISINLRCGVGVPDMKNVWWFSNNKYLLADKDFVVVECACLNRKKQIKNTEIILDFTPISTLYK